LILKKSAGTIIAIQVEGTSSTASSAMVGPSMGGAVGGIPARGPPTLQRVKEDMACCFVKVKKGEEKRGGSFGFSWKLETRKELVEMPILGNRF
jgi:hypothetical protein